MRLGSGAAAALIALGCSGASAMAQEARSSILEAGSVPAIRAEVQKRYESALALTLDNQILRANDSRYIFASEAKVACGIAIGYLKTGTVHQESINKCDDFSRRMTLAAPAAAAPLPAPVPATEQPQPMACAISLPVQVFFDFNMDMPPSEASNIVQQIAGGMSACGWTGLTITGHADRAGSDTYNQALSERRARNIAALFGSAGVPSSALNVEAKGERALLVETLDGVREPQNRRVTIDAAARP